MDVHDNHISIKSASEVEKICEELFNYSDINYFIFVRFYDDGTVVSLPTNYKWHQHFWRKKYQERSVIRLSEGINFWHSKEKLSDVCEDAVRNFHLDNRLDIVEREETYYDVFGFGSQPEKTQMIDYYFNHLDELRKFCLFFREKAKILIKNGDKRENRLIIEEIKQASFTKIISSEKFSSKLNIQKYYLGNYILSRREAECLILLLRGRTAVEIGNLLNISSKTSESYMEKIKNKLCCSNRAELFDKAYSLQVHELAKDISFTNIIKLKK
jgi:DNA-binding CsgD family transcriptional regulator